MDSESLVNIRVKNNRGMPWIETTFGKVKGYAFLNNQLLTAQDLADYCSHATGHPDCDQMLSRLNGCFTLILRTPDAVWLIADKLKTYPLFYLSVDGTYYITDTGQDALKYLPRRILKKSSLLQFVSCGYLTGGDTLFKDVNLVPPASLVKITSKGVEVHRYSTRIQPKVHRSKEEVFQQGAEAFEHAFQRTLQRVAGRTIVLPLSGGYDSRMIACLCRKHNVENVICYSYGIEGSQEVEISRQTAEQLHYPWHSVTCTAEKWGTLVKSSSFLEYIQYGGNLNAIAHIQDFLALHELTRKGVIPPDSVFIPGHTGDVLGGSHLPKEIGATSIVNDLYDKYFCLNILQPRMMQVLTKNMYQSIGLNYPVILGPENCYEAFYQWSVDTRQSNFIINAVRAYEYFGYEWLLPMWDDEFEGFWSSIPFSERVGSALYTEFAFRNYFEPMQVDYHKPEESSLPSPRQQFIRKFVPKDDRYLIKLILSKLGFYHFPKDNAGLDEAAKALKKIFTIDIPEIALQKEEIMSVKTLYYLSLLNPAKELD